MEGGTSRAILIISTSRVAHLLNMVGAEESLWVKRNWWTKFQRDFQSFGSVESRAFIVRAYAKRIGNFLGVRTMAAPDLEEKICIRCAEKTPHEVIKMDATLQMVVVVVVFGLFTAFTGIGGMIPAVIVSVPVYWGLGRLKKYVCHLCGCRYRIERANRFVRERNRARRKELWEEQKHRRP